KLASWAWQGGPAVALSPHGVHYLGHGGRPHSAELKVGEHAPPPVVEQLEVVLAADIGRVAHVEGGAVEREHQQRQRVVERHVDPAEDRKSTRLNSSHV